MAGRPDGYPIIRPGDRVRVTALIPVRGRGDSPETPAGTVIEGVARNVERDGFFDLYPDDGEPCGFVVDDPGSRVEVVARAER